MAPFPGPLVSRRRSTGTTRFVRSRQKYERVSGVAIATNSQQTNGDITATSLQAAAETVMASTIVGAYANVRGVFDIAIGPTAGAPTFTRVNVGLGIAWARRDLVTSGASSATFPNPLADSDVWLWRRMYPVTFAATSTVAGTDKERYPNQGRVGVSLRTRRAQPSAAHQLYLFTSIDAATDANITSVAIYHALVVSFAIP